MLNTVSYVGQHINAPDVYSSWSLLDSVDESLSEDPPLSLSPASLPVPSLPTLLDSLDVGVVETELSPLQFAPGLLLFTPGRL